MLHIKQKDFEFLSWLNHLKCSMMTIITIKKIHSKKEKVADLPTLIKQKQTKIGLSFQDHLLCPNDGVFIFVCLFFLLFFVCVCVAWLFWDICLYGPVTCISLLKLSLLPTLSQATTIGHMLFSVVWAKYWLILCNCILYSVRFGNWEMKFGANVVELFYDRVVVFGNLFPFLLFI